MKLSIVLCNTALVATTLQAAASALPTRIHRFCFMPGEACTRHKRAVDAFEGNIGVSDIEVLQVRHLREHHFCYMPGEPCYKAKRSMLALVEAIAEREEVADPKAEGSTFHAGGSVAAMFRRDVEEHEANATAYFEANPNTKPRTNNDHPICHEPDGPCTQLNQARQLIEAAITQRSSGGKSKHEPESHAMHKGAL